MKTRYGLLAFAVVRRTGEIGIRIALGAAQGDVLWMILKEALLLASAGVAIGLPAAVVVGRVAASRIPGLLFGLQTADFATLAASAMLLPIVTILAAYVPARRASHVDPMTALRNE
jgi:ABC-type antimicrobial peptide transport system permease subunit